MIKLKDLLIEDASFDLIDSWKQTIPSSEIRYFCKRDNCGPAAISFMQFLTKQGKKGLKRVEGFFKADTVVSDKNDFTPEMKKEFMQSGGNWNSSKERKQWIENSKYARQWKYIPHYWVEDSNGTIYDPVGQEQFINTGLAKDLNKKRYTLTDKI